ncbi:MAG: PQQ-dependent sugar dehydrogenase [Candidatus Krumholzibacteria bacterium]
MRIALGVFLILAAACGVPALATVEIRNAFPNITFTQPVDIQHAGDGTNRLFIAELSGLIWVVENDSTITQRKLFLDIQGPVGGGEGLLGLAFHPDYSSNGFFFVNYTASAPNRSVIARFEVSATNPDSAAADSLRVILEIPQPFGNHNGGAIAFGPGDGYLYVPMGDGGSQGDPAGNGQNTTNLFSSIIRIDVDSTAGGLNYVIPADNPFVGNMAGVREEIWAWGFRNPWRCSFDPVTGRFWVGDVGQDAIEEIDVVEKGKNYGWNIMEGESCFNPPAGCDTTGLTLPAWQYLHSLGNSVTGGYVYRGTMIPSLVGQYVYADFGSGRVWSLDYDGISPTVNTQLMDTVLRITSFGVDRDGELYLCAFIQGVIYRFFPCAPTAIPDGTPHLGAPSLGQNYPNPFNPVTRITYSLPQAGHVRLSVYDVAGRLIDGLVDTVQPVGEHAVVWDAAGLPSGIYFYRLQAGGVTETRKMVLLK